MSLQLSVDFVVDFLGAQILCSQHNVVVFCHVLHNFSQNHIT